MRKSVPRDIAVRSRESLDRNNVTRAFTRKTYSLPREQARATAAAYFKQYPKEAYGTEIESWSVRPGDVIEFTIRRLPTAD